MSSQQSQSSSKPASRTLLTIGDRKKIRDYHHRSAKLSTRGLADWASLEFGRAINEQTCRQCISDSDAYLDEIEEGSAYAQYTRADSLKKALTLNRTLQQLADKPPYSIETIRKHAESVWTTIAIPTKAKPKFTDAWMQEFALRYREYPVADDTNVHHDERNTPVDEPADAVDLAEAPSSSRAGAGVACSAYQRSVRSQRSKGAWATRPGTELAVDQDTPSRRAATTVEEQNNILVGSRKRAHDELYSAPSDEDNVRRMKRRRAVNQARQEAELDNVPAHSPGFRKSGCICGHRPAVYKTVGVQTDPVPAEAETRRDPAIQSDNAIFLSFLEMTGRALLVAFTELWHIDRTQYDSFFKDLARCPTGDEDAIPYMQSVLQKSVPRRTDRTVGTVMARFSGHYDKDGIDAVDDWVTRIAASTFGANDKPGQPPTTQVTSGKSEAKVHLKEDLARESRQTSHPDGAMATNQNMSRVRSWEELLRLHGDIVQANPHSSNKQGSILRAASQAMDDLTRRWRTKNIAAHLQKGAENTSRSERARIIKDAEEEMIRAEGVFRLRMRSRGMKEEKFQSHSQQRLQANSHARPDS